VEWHEQFERSIVAAEHTVAETHSCGDHGSREEPDADYIALMHPPVALALADLLDQVARHVDARIAAEQRVGLAPGEIQQVDEIRAVDVARAILREEATDA
jgi:hypothetical protein